MGCTVKEKHVRPNRKPDSDDRGLVSIKSVASRLKMDESEQNPDPNPSFDDSGSGYCTEEELEQMLLKKLESLYNQAIGKLVAMGYDEEIALSALLANGHCYGGMDALTNVLQNSLAYLNSWSGGNEGNPEDTKQAFADLRQLRDFSLACLVCLLRRMKPSLSRGDAIWCLLMSGLHVGRASMMEIPFAQNPSGDGNTNSKSSSPAVNNMGKVNNDSIGVTLASCRFNGGWGFGNRGTSDLPVNRSLSHEASDTNLGEEIECPKWSNRSPTKRMLLKSNVALFAAEYRANLKEKQVQSQAGSGSLSHEDSSSVFETKDEAHPPLEQRQGTLSVKDQESLNIMLKKLCALKLEDVEFVAEDQKDEMIFSLVDQIKDLERQVKERKEWANQKAIQAARKLSHDLTELKMLRMEREGYQRLKQWKPTPEDPMLKRLLEMENALRKASGQVDRANAVVRRLELENAEIRAEMEASNLSASESVTMRLEVARRERKYLKKLLAWEKQRANLQDDITTEKQKIIELQEEMLQVEAANKTVEAKWMEQQKAKDLALAQVEEERRLKEATEANNKRNHEALRSKIELDFQRHKDDLQRLEQELARLKASTDLDHLPNAPHAPGQTIAKLLHDLDDSDEKEAGIDRECILCSKEEVSVVFLPCAHQVLCAGCNDKYGKRGRATCPICRVPIEQRIRVFGASS